MGVCHWVAGYRDSVGSFWWRVVDVAVPGGNHNRSIVMRSSNSPRAAARVHTLATVLFACGGDSIIPPVNCGTARAQRLWSANWRLDFDHIFITDNSTYRECIVGSNGIIF